MLEAASDLTRGAQDPDDPLLQEPMSDASGGEPEDALIPESEPTQPADEETFFETDPANTSSAATETDTETDPSDIPPTASTEATAAAEDALNPVSYTHLRAHET